MAARHSPSPKVVETLLAQYPEAASMADKAGNLPLHLAFLRPLFKPGAKRILASQTSTLCSFAAAAAAEFRAAAAAATAAI